MDNDIINRSHISDCSCKYFGFDMRLSECTSFWKFRCLVFNVANTAEYTLFDTVMRFGEKHFPHRWNELICERSGDTVVHLAARSGCLYILKYCNENYGGETIFTKVNLDGKTPLHIASQEGKLDCVKYLLSLGLHPDPLKKGDWTPLMLACAKGHFSIVQELMKARADQFLKNKDGWTAFHIACRAGYLEVVKYLCDKDIKICLTESKNGRTPLHSAALHGCCEIVDFLLTSLDCWANEKDTCGTTPLMDAVRGDYINVLQLLQRFDKENGKTVDLLGRNILHIAAECGSNKCINYLVSNAIVNINSKTVSTGQTSLHFAAREGHFQTVKLMIELGADVMVTDNKGRTAQDLALLKNHLSCIEAINYMQS